MRGDLPLFKTLDYQQTEMLDTEEEWRYFYFLTYLQNANVMLVGHALYKGWS